MSGTELPNARQHATAEAGDPAATIHRLYEAFARLDADTMAGCYAADARFEDPVFRLQGRREIAGMWSMLCESVRRDGAGQWRLSHDQVSAAAGLGVARWHAHYRFSATGRLVENHIAARLRFDAAGRIIDHQDSFDFWRWSRQALGIPGLLLGWTPYLRGKVRAQARRRLERYLAGAAGGATIRS